MFLKVGSELLCRIPFTHLFSSLAATPHILQLRRTNSIFLARHVIVKHDLNELSILRVWTTKNYGTGRTLLPIYLFAISI